MSAPDPDSLAQAIRSLRTDPPSAAPSNQTPGEAWHEMAMAMADQIGASLGNPAARH
jgi:hypothetical protein